MKWSCSCSVSLAGAVLFAHTPANAESVVVPLGLAGAGDMPDLQLVQLKTSRDADILDLAFWNTIKDSDNPADYQAYLEVFPSGAFAPLAKLRLWPVAESRTWLRVTLYDGTKGYLYSELAE